MSTKISWSFFVALVAIACCNSPSAFADDSKDYWSSWRARQRAELATLPKPPEPPDGAGSAVDRWLGSDWAKAKVSPPAPVDDAASARRAYLDVVGLLP